MGYRSEVAYVIRFGSKTDMDTFVALQLTKADEWITQALKELSVVDADQPNPVLYFYADSVKWYDGYKDVEAHKTLMNEVVELFPDAGWHFIRCGEETDDITDECDGGDTDLTWEYLTINRPTINTDIGDTTPLIPTEEKETV